MFRKSKGTALRQRVSRKAYREKNRKGNSPSPTSFGVTDNSLSA